MNRGKEPRTADQRPPEEREAGPGPDAPRAAPPEPGAAARGNEAGERIREGAAPGTPASSRSMAPVGVPVEPVPTLSQRLLRMLPRVALVLVILAILIVFHAVLLPFALAVFVAYLLYPVIARIEQGRVGSWHWSLPRWVAVIAVYAALFTIGWNLVPRIVSNLAAEMGQLKDEIPALFARFGQWQRDVDRRLVQFFEVQQLSESTKVAMRNDLDALQAGTLSLVEELSATESPVGAPAPGEGPAPDAPGPPQMSLINVNIHLSLPDGRRFSAPPPAAPAEAAEGSTPVESIPSTLGEGEELSGSDPGEETAPVADTVAPEEPDSPKLFSDEARNLFLRDLFLWLNEKLAEEGAASEKLPDQAAAQVQKLATEHLHLTPDDPRLEEFQAVLASHVRTATRGEEYAGVVRDEMSSALLAARTWATNLLKQSTSVATNLVAGVFDFFLVLMLTAFFLIFFPRMRDYGAGLFPPSYRSDYYDLLKRIDTRLSGAVRGQVIICCVNALLTYPGIYYIGKLAEAPSLIRFAALLSVLAGLFSLIPIFGVIISTIPMVLIALTQSTWAALAVVVWISIIHAIEAYFLNPNILGHTARMNPIIVVFALLAGKYAGGLIGALLAVPIMSVVVVMFGYYRRRLARVYAAEAGVELRDDDWGD